MARIIPKVLVDEIELKPERDVARALIDLLPNDCIVYHSYPWLKSDRNDRDGRTTLREGEADFVVVVPSHGLLVLEVKGGDIEYETDNRGWNRRLYNGRLKKIKDPFEQARRNTHYLADEIQSKSYPGRGNLPFTFGYAVIFPDCEYRGPTPPGAEPAIVLSSRDLGYLDRRVTEVLRQWSRSTSPSPLERSDLDSIQRAISPAFRLLPVLFRQIEEQEEKLFRLTEEQLRLLGFLAQRDRAAIEGVAGSGKTMLARAQAQIFADVGKRTLVVCYNKALAGWLRESIPETYSKLITVRHFHGLCREWCNLAGISFAPPRTGQDQFWREQAPGLLLDALDILSERFDAVVVDEGQDFFPDWWLPLEMINVAGDRGSMYVFYDPAQNLFVDGISSLPAFGAAFTLPTNCRNTRNIAATCGEILDVEIRTHPNAPEGTKTRFLVASSKYDQEKLCRKELESWIRKGSLNYSQVAILSPFRREVSSLSSSRMIGKMPLTEDLDSWKRSDSILFTTIRAFKGLEADAIVIIDVPEVGSIPTFSKTDFYVACSRAKHLLTVLKKGSEMP